MARLRYISDEMPGIRRVRSGRSFRYLTHDGAVIRDPGKLRRIRSLVIPPAWTDVWICPIPEGHLQATGRDARGRKQYRYHPRWKEVRDETKYGKMVAFGQALASIRSRVDRDLSRRELSRSKVLATVVRLLELTCIRVGNEEYARINRSYGLTTLRDHHVNVAGSQIDFRFRGKSGKERAVRLVDRKLARIVKRCRDLPGYELFQYVDQKGSRHVVGSADVNRYLRDISGRDFTAKDFRTWAGTVAALTGLQRCGPAPTAAGAKRNVAAVVKEVAEQLGNTPAVSRKSYIHPSVVQGYTEGSLVSTLAQLREGRNGRGRLSPEERLTLAFLSRASRGSGVVGCRPVQKIHSNRSRARGSR